MRFISHSIGKSIFSFARRIRYKSTSSEISCRTNTLKKTSVHEHYCAFEKNTIIPLKSFGKGWKRYNTNYVVMKTNAEMTVFFFFPHCLQTVYLFPGVRYANHCKSKFQAFVEPVTG